MVAQTLEASSTDLTTVGIQSTAPSQIRLPRGPRDGRNHPRELDVPRSPIGMNYRGVNDGKGRASVADRNSYPDHPSSLVLRSPELELFQTFSEQRPGGRKPKQC